MMKTKSLFLVLFLTTLIGYSQCENSPMLPDNVSQSLGCYIYPMQYHYDFFTQDQELKGGNPDYTVSFHLSQADADNDINQTTINYFQSIGEPPMFQIFARVVDQQTGCVGVKAFDCQQGMGVFPVIPTLLIECDNDGDGFTSFDLTSKNNEIYAAPNAAITYHLTEDDAINDFNPLPSPYTNVQTNSQIVFARVTESPVGFCPDPYGIVPLTLQTDNCLSINNFDKEGFTIYVNSADRQLVIVSSKMQNGALSLTNLLGKQILASNLELKGKTNKVDVSHLPKGLYFATLRYNTKRVVKKLMIK